LGNRKREGKKHQTKKGRGESRNARGLYSVEWDLPETSPYISVWGGPKERPSRRNIPGLARGGGCGTGKPEWGSGRGTVGEKREKNQRRKKVTVEN